MYVAELLLYIYIYIYIYIYSCIYIYIRRTYTHTSTLTHIHTCIRALSWICACVLSSDLLLVVTATEELMTSTHPFFEGHPTCVTSIEELQPVDLENYEHQVKAREPEQHTYIAE